MNRTSLVLFVLAALSAVAGTAMFSPRVAVLVAGVCLAAAGVAMLDVRDRP